MPTTSLELGLLLLAVQFAGMTIALAVVLLKRGRATEQQQTQAVTGLVNKVEATADARREALKTVFSDTYQFDGEEAERVVTDFIERERAFYNAMIGVHLGRGGKTLADVPAELTKVVAPWLRLTPKHMVSADAVEALETANSALSAELESTKRVLDELMEEYNAAFHKENRLAQAAAADMHGEDLLSIDDSEPVPRAAPSPTAAAEAVDGEIIALDLDMGDAMTETNAPDALTPNDLDALMENLDADYEPAEVAA